jgi:acyl-CoA thioesterase I
MFLFHIVHKRLSRHPASRFFAGSRMLAIFLPVLVMMTAPLGAAEPAVKLMVFGDSLSAGYGLQKPNSFTEKLSKALQGQGLNVNVIAASVSGDTTAGGKARLDWAMVDKPDAVLLELGANDGLRGIEPAASRANLSDILQRLKSKGTRVLIAGMLAPPNLGKEYGAEFNQIYTGLARHYKFPLYPFFLEGVAAMPHLNQKDGIHPNPQGVDEIVKRILPMVVKLVR